MGLSWTPESEYALEMRKWEMRPTVTCPDYTVLPRFNTPFQEYPKMMVKARRQTGGPRIDLTDTPLATSERHQAELERQGYHASQELAIAAVHAEDQDWATLAAERHHAERRMSPQAQAEAAAADDATPAHLPVIEAAPIRPHGTVITTDFQIERAALQREIDALNARLHAREGHTHAAKPIRPSRAKKPKAAPVAPVEESR